MGQGYTTRYGADASDPVRLVGEVAAILSLGAGVIHVSAAGDHTNLPVMFAGFVAVAALQVALGALLLWRRPSKLLIAAGVALMTGSIAIWLVSRTQGLPFLEDGHTEPIGAKDGVTVLFELASIPALLLLLSSELARVSLPSPRLASRTLTGLGAVCFALMVPALMLEGGGHHSHEQAVALGIHDDSDHGEGDEVAHADTGSHETEGERSHHAKGHDEKGDSGSHGHSGAAGTGGDHQHSGVQLASAPLDTGHDHESDEGSDKPKHDSHKGKNRDRGDGDHGHGRPDRGRGHGDHEDEQPGGAPDDDGPVTVSYEPEPSVCVTGICLP